jgi:hypothetical protein
MAVYPAQRRGCRFSQHRCRSTRQQRDPAAVYPPQIMRVKPFIQAVGATAHCLPSKQRHRPLGWNPVIERYLTRSVLRGFQTEGASLRFPDTASQLRPTHFNEAVLEVSMATSHGINTLNQRVNSSGERRFCWLYSIKRVNQVWLPRTYSLCPALRHEASR